MHTKLFVTLALSLLAFSSCKKSVENPIDILTSKTWKKGIIDKNPSTNPSGTVLYSAVRDCENDDTFQFGSDGNLIVNRGADKCDPNELVTVSEPYTLNRKENELIIKGVRFTLAEESSTQIKYYAQPGPGSGYQYVIFLLQ
jgi:hypothetical protein